MLRCCIPLQNNTKLAPDGNFTEGGLFSRLGEYESRRKTLDVERHNDYNKRMNEVRPSTFLLLYGVLCDIKACVGCCLRIDSTPDM